MSNHKPGILNNYIRIYNIDCCCLTVVEGPTSNTSCILMRTISQYYTETSKKWDKTRVLLLDCQLSRVGMNWYYSWLFLWFDFMYCNNPTPSLRGHALFATREHLMSTSFFQQLYRESNTRYSCNVTDYHLMSNRIIVYIFVYYNNYIQH